MSEAKTESSSPELPAPLAEALAEFESGVAGVDSREAWDVLRVQWLGRKQGRLRELQQLLREVSREEKPRWGKGLNRVKNTVETALAEMGASFEEAERSATQASAAIDVTLPGRLPDLGSLHPITHVMREIERIFLQLGFSVAEGPEIEDDFHNFEALNLPEGHPARDEQDTFFLTDGRLLRTHTSPVQVRTMVSREPPIRIIAPGRVYRIDNDLRHSPMFHQIEGLCVDEGVTFGHLKGTLQVFLERFFAGHVDVRLRPSFFPFTEPSAEVDVSCPFCEGSGQLSSGESCGTCSATGWMEILGCGMVDPRVFEKCGIDSERYTGWAFGLGIDRVAMALYGLPNIRALYDNDERLLRQIGF